MAGGNYLQAEEDVEQRGRWGRSHISNLTLLGFINLRCSAHFVTWFDFLFNFSRESDCRHGVSTLTWDATRLCSCLMFGFIFSCVCLNKDWLHRKMDFCMNVRDLCLTKMPRLIDFNRILQDLTPQNKKWLRKSPFESFMSDLKVSW